MRSTTQCIAAAVAATVLALGATSLRASDSNGMTAPQSQEGQYGQKQNKSMQGHTAMQSDYRVSLLLGKEVRDSANQKVGDIKDVIINLQSGRASYAIIGMGGALGLGETRVAVPLRDLQFTSDNRLTIAATKQQLESASPTASGPWAAVANEPWAHGVDRFYGQPNASRFERETMGGQGQEREPVRNPGLNENSQSWRNDTDQGAGAEQLSHPGNTTNQTNSAGSGY